MRIEWIVQGVQGSWEEGLTSPLASNRYRAILPATFLRDRGHTVDLVSPAGWTWATAHERADVFVVGKLLPGQDLEHFHRLSDGLRREVRIACDAGGTVLADFNDDHFEHPTLGLHWRHMARSVGRCIAGSGAMAERIKAFTDRPISVVGDPIASALGEPRVFLRQGGLARSIQALLPGSGRQRLKLVWYGNPTNWDTVPAWCESLARVADQQPLLLWVVTRPDRAIEAFIDQFNVKHESKMLIRLLPWEESTQWDVVRDADVVLIPSEPGDPRKAVKSANRLTDALHAGRYVIASPVPAYLPFAEFVSLSDEPGAALMDYVSNPSTALRRLRDGQARVVSTFAPSTIAAAWEAALQAPNPPLLATDSQVTRRGGEPVRLNLGCGDKIIAGYVNVDVVESRAGRRPDVLCDLRELAVFSDDYADEVMAIHVVEHFWRWEVESVLREWVRVLKPGGKLVLECPNLEAACTEFLRNPDAASGPGPEGQMSMWVFYGDPGWKDPLMVHRWGYTPGSLARLLESVGLADVRQEAAQFKKREPRDMRIVGRKPG